MTSETINIDDLLNRHLELAVRLYDMGYLSWSLDVTLATLHHEPPSAESAMLKFLLGSILPVLVQSQTDIGQRLHYTLASRDDIRREVMWWTQYFINYHNQEAMKRRRDELSETLLSLDKFVHILEQFSAEDLQIASSEKVPAGTARGVYVEPSGQAELTRVYVRFGRWDELAGKQIVGQPLPGAKSALDAARQYLKRAGCNPVDGLQAEVLVEGLFKPIQGESLALAVFLAAVSAMLQMPIADECVFTGAIGVSSVDSSGGETATLMPIDELNTKLKACEKAGCSHLIVPVHLIAVDDLRQTSGRCTLEPIATTKAAVERVIPRHRFVESPKIAGWKRTFTELMLSFIPERHEKRKELGMTLEKSPSHRIYLIVVPLLFASLITERWLIADYLIPEYYLGVFRPSFWLAVLLGTTSTVTAAAAVYAGLNVVDRLIERNSMTTWWHIAVLLLGAFVISGVLAQFIIRNPFAPPLRGLYLEHRTLQWWKDVMLIYLYLLIFYISPYTRLRLAERAATAGRHRWAKEILEGRRWAAAAFPVTSLAMFVVIASVAIMGLGYLDWQSLVDKTRAGTSGLENGPWRSIHIVGRAHMLVLSCVTTLWWIARSYHKVNKRCEYFQLNVCIAMSPKGK